MSVPKTAKPTRAEEASAYDEGRFAKWIRWAEPSEHRPDLGPCLVWTGGLSHGYGQFTYNSRHGYAHRYAWERIHGPILNDLTVDHLCRVRNCVNIEHLELVTREENFRRGVAARRATGKCRHGHEYTPENTFEWNGKRQCLTCRVRARRESDARRSERKRMERAS